MVYSTFPMKKGKKDERERPFLLDMIPKVVLARKKGKKAPVEAEWDSARLGDYG